jgi:hypothetical protein
VRRHAIGIIAIVLLLGAGALWIWRLETTWYLPLKSACTRLGPCMAVLWLAYPDVKRLPAWLLPTIPLLLAILAYKPRLFLIALPVVILLVIIRPKGRQRK